MSFSVARAMPPAMKVVICLFTILIFSTVWWIPSLAAQELSLILSPAIEPHGQGEINWSEGTISATGFGAPPPQVPSAAARTMAARAAVAVARRNLLELIEGVRIDAETTVENFMIKSDIIQSQVQGLVKNAIITQRRDLPDGNVEVVLSMPMWGNDSLITSLVPETAARADGIRSDRHSQMGEYSGLIIDSQNLRVQPATFPTVTDEEGQALFDRNTVPADLLGKKGMVQYFIPAPHSSRGFPNRFLKPVAEQPPQPEAQERVGPRPLHIKGLQKTGSQGTDIMVSTEDAEKIRKDPGLLELLRNANVIIVIDPLVAGVEGRLGPGNILPVKYP